MNEKLCVRTKCCCYTNKKKHRQRKKNYARTLMCSRTFKYLNFLQICLYYFFKIKLPILRWIFFFATFRSIRVSYEHLFYMTFIIKFYLILSFSKKRKKKIVVCIAVLWFKYVMIWWWSFKSHKFTLWHATLLDCGHINTELKGAQRIEWKCVERIIKYKRNWRLYCYAVTAACHLLLAVVRCFYCIALLLLTVSFDNNHIQYFVYTTTSSQLNKTSKKKK